MLGRMSFGSSLSATIVGMDWRDILSEPLEEDLSEFSRFLSARGVRHRIVECDGRQVLRSCDDRDAINIWFEQWRAGQLDVPPPIAKTDGMSFLTPLKIILHYPVVLVTSGLAVLVYLIAGYSNTPLLWLAFQDTAINDNGFLHASASINSITEGQWWRLITPIFLHFSLLHIVFNGLWLIEFGRRIESLQSHTRLLAVIITSGVISNLCQYIYEPSVLFGGLSGVVYGLFGYSWLLSYNKLPIKGNAQRAIAPPPGIAPFLFFWLLLCMSGVLSVVDIHVANAAHVGGLFSGFLIALVYRFK